MNQTSHRAGAYVRQPAGYQAFMPSNLPPTDPPLRYDEDLQELLSKANLSLGRLDGSISTLPNPDLFVFMYVRKEAVLSSQIEGTQSSLNDLLAAEAEVQNITTPKDVAEVINYVNAMNHGLMGLEELPVSLRLIKQIHALLLQGARGQHLTPGELRTSQNWIGPGGCTLTEAEFVPPPPHELANAVGQWERFLHAPDRMPLLIRIGLAHAQFETIHPFLDGNGRVGRLLITFLLCEKGVLSLPVLYLSHYFKQNRSEYYERLQNIRDRGQWEEWIKFFLQGVERVSAQAAETAKNILQLREYHRSSITQSMASSAANAYLVLEHLYRQPIISANQVKDLTGTSYPAANNLVKRFEELGLIEEVTGKARNRRYRYSPYIDLFDD
jgi:Fic family protein